MLWWRICTGDISLTRDNSQDVAAKTEQKIENLKFVKSRMLTFSRQVGNNTLEV